MKLPIGMLTIVLLTGCAHQSFTLNTSESAAFPVVADVVCIQASRRDFIPTLQFTMLAYMHTRWTAKFRIVRLLHGQTPHDRFWLDDAEAEFAMKGYWRFVTNRTYSVGFDSIKTNGKVKGLQIIVPPNYFQTNSAAARGPG